MALNFEEIKKIRIIEVCARYGIALRYRGDYANGVCKLPTHKQGDKSRAFSVNVAENYWRCFSDSCNAKNQGRKGGDVINLVALLENCSEFQAAEKLATWYGLNGKELLSTAQKPIVNSGQNGKPKRFMETIDLWFDELVKRGDQEDEPAFWHRVRNGVKAKLMENWRNGVKAGKEGKS
jgi:hypothetical protein